MELPALALNFTVINDMKSILGDGFKAIVDDQVKQAEWYLGDIKNLLLNGEYLSAMKRAHALKSSCNQIGLMGIADMSNNLEHICRDYVATPPENKNEAMINYKEIVDSFEDAVERLQAFISLSSSPNDVRSS